MGYGHGRKREKKARVTLLERPEIGKADAEY